MERINKDLENCRQRTQIPITYEYPHDAPDYIEPTPGEKRQRWLSRYAGVTDTENTFDKMRIPAGFEKTIKAFRDMVNGAGWFMLLVYGLTGTGKSKCCEATVIALYDKGEYAIRLRWSDIVRHLKDLMGKGGYEAFFNGLREKKYLIIDDVGGGSTGGNWEWGELEDIVDYRLEHRLFTIITTNLDIKDIPDRIRSRFRDKRNAMMVWDQAPDQRPLEG